MGSQGISLSICVQAAARADSSRCLGGNNNSLIAQSDYITARHGEDSEWIFGFIAIFGTTLQEEKKQKLMTRRLTNKIEICLMVSPLCLGDAAY